MIDSSREYLIPILISLYDYKIFMELLLESVQAL
jgi:hypothetical protein